MVAQEQHGALPGLTPAIKHVLDQRQVVLLAQTAMQQRQGVAEKGWLLYFVQSRARVLSFEDMRSCERRNGRCNCPQPGRPLSSSRRDLCSMCGTHRSVLLHWSQVQGLTQALEWHDGDISALGCRTRRKVAGQLFDAIERNDQTQALHILTSQSTGHSPAALAWSKKVGDNEF